MVDQEDVTPIALLNQSHCWPTTVHINKTCQICHKLLLEILLCKSVTQQGLPEHLMQMHANEHTDVGKKAKEACPSLFFASKSRCLILKSAVQQSHQKQVYILYDSIFMKLKNRQH